MAVGPSLFALLVWGSVGSVLVAFGYLVWLLVVLKRDHTVSSDAV